MRAAWLSNISSALLAGSVAIVVLSKPRTASVYAGAATLAGLGLALQWRAERAGGGGAATAAQLQRRWPDPVVIDVTPREVVLQ